MVRETENGNKVVASLKTDWKAYTLCINVGNFAEAKDTENCL